MLILSIGPSGVGKSSLASYASAKLSNCKFDDLDNLIAKESRAQEAQHVLIQYGSDIFFQKSVGIVENIRNQNDKQLYLIAVGAGTLESLQSKNWLKNYTTISITAPPEEVIVRNPLGPDRDIEEFKMREYSPFRLSLYQSANFNFPVDGLTETEAQAKFVEFLNEEILKNYDVNNRQQFKYLRRNNGPKCDN